MFKYFISILTTFLLSVSYAQTIIPAGNVFGTWTLVGSPYIVTGDIAISQLTIQAGVDVRFQNMAAVTVSGSIKAIGSLTLPVTFEADDTTGWSNFSLAAGGFEGIILNAGPSDTSIFDYCVLKDTKDLPFQQAYGLCGNGCYFELLHSEICHNYNYSCGAAITVFAGSSPLISNNSIHDNIGNSAGAIEIQESHGVISLNNIFNNTSTTGGAIHCWSIADPTGPMIIENNIHHNHSNIDGGGIKINNGKGTIERNIISFNTSGRAGSGIYVADSRAKIFSNRICNNTDTINSFTCGITDGGGGIYISNGGSNDTAFVCNNVIANNNTSFRGGGIRLLSGTAIIENNDIVYNLCSNSPVGFYSGGLDLLDSSYAMVRNNIFWGNRAYDSNNNLDSVQVCSLQNDTLTLEYNFAEVSALGGAFFGSSTQVNGNQASNIAVLGLNPNLVAPTAGAGISFDATIANWRLSFGSPCIDVGTLTYLSWSPQQFDVYDSIRISGSSIDIGASEYPSTSGIIEYAKKSIVIFPNPTMDILYMTFGNSNTEIRITDMLGNTILNQKYGNGIEVGSLASGIYFVSFQDENGILQTERFMKQ
jgi:hypothetical protein